MNRTSTVFELVQIAGKIELYQMEYFMINNDDLKFVGMYLSENYSQFSAYMDEHGFNESECDEMIQKLDPDFEP